MVSNSMFMSGPERAISASKRRDILHSLVVAASTAVNAQIDELTVRLATSLLDHSETAIDSKQANGCFNAANLLKNNAYPFYHVASARLRARLQDEVDLLDTLIKRATAVDADELTLVPFAEMEKKLLLDNAARPLEITHAGPLAAVNLRMAALLGRDQLTTAENPFRPDVFMAAMNDAWREFDPHEESHHLMLQQIHAGVFLDLSPVLEAISRAFVDAGVMPNLSEGYQIRKSGANLKNKKDARPDPAQLKQLRRMFEHGHVPEAPGGAPSPGAQPGQFATLPDIPGFPPFQDSNASQGTPTAAGITPALSAYLSALQQRAGQTAPASGNERNRNRLSEIRDNLPRGAMTRVDETTIDVMTRIFDAVFRDQNIPPEMKELIGFLQIPVLKAALLDKEFFFEESHPARRLISLLTASSIGWDQNKGQSDPLYQAISRNVDRVQQFDSEVTLFADVVADLEAFFGEEEKRSTARLATPITQALKQEKLREATRSATSDVAVRVATGEVATFVEAFLESRWVPVLTLAHTVKDEKPHVLESAIKTMDELIWSVQPKIDMQQRKELVAKLPALLTTLNKWLNVLKWDDADRLQFFADLAECHASIVRAPLELSPHRQLEIAVEAAQKAAERRLEKRAALPPEPEPDAFIESVEQLERGMWFEFSQPDGSIKKVKLAWVSPLRSLYIFTTVHRQEAFSLAADILAQAFREDRVKVVEVDGIINRALVDALEVAGAEQPGEAESTTV
ncbi:MAG: DUF1631 family protein [Herminiimonas sp.]|nr:DUF1631 family protein [Herminiimonas sp.]